MLVAFLCIGLPVLGLAMLFVAGLAGGCVADTRTMEPRCAPGLLHGPLIALTWVAIYSMCSILMTPVWLVLGLVVGVFRKLWESVPEERAQSGNEP